MTIITDTEIDSINNRYTYMTIFQTCDRMKKINIGIITEPITKNGISSLDQLIKILNTISKDQYLITGGEGYSFFKNDNQIVAFNNPFSRNAIPFLRIFRYFFSQIWIAFKVMQLRKNVDIWVFFIGCEDLIVPHVVAKIWNKKTILVLPGNTIKYLELKKDIFLPVFYLISVLNFEIAGNIFVYSDRIVKERNLNKYSRKISIASQHILDNDQYQIKKRISQRSTIIGYIGTLSEVKGIFNFIQAIPLVLAMNESCSFFIGGEGYLREPINEYIKQNKLGDKVKLFGWVPQEKLPDYLNDLKLLVLPSYSEGLPNIILEAMACGTPVLATSVGAIPDIIQDGKTGFLMNDNSPEEIAQNIIKILNDPNLEEISSNGSIYVNNEYSLKMAVSRFEKVFVNNYGD